MLRVGRGVIFLVASSLLSSLTEGFAFLSRGAELPFSRASFVSSPSTSVVVFEDDGSLSPVSSRNLRGQMDMRWARARRTKRITKDTGGNHIMELNRERRRLGSQFSKSPTIRDPRSLFISNVDPEVGHVEIEEFLEYYYGLGTCLVKLYHDKGTGGHKGYGHVHFVDPIQATSALLNFNGVKFGKSNIALSERYTSDYLERQSGAGSTTRRAIASKEF